MSLMKRSQTWGLDNQSTLELATGTNGAVDQQVWLAVKISHNKVELNTLPLLVSVQMLTR